MFYRATNGRCAVCFDSLKLPLPIAECVRILESLDFTLLTLDPITTARALVGRPTWKRKIQYRYAPEVVNCSTFVKWVYGQCGVWLPRRAIQQRECGEAVS